MTEMLNQDSRPDSGQGLTREAALYAVSARSPHGLHTASTRSRMDDGYGNELEGDRGHR